MKAYLNDADNMEIASYIYNECDGNKYCAEVGKGNITEIRYHYPEGTGDHHFVDVYKNGELAYRDFNIDSICFKHKKGGIE